MAIEKIWVFAQEANGAPTSATLELLTKARSLGGTLAAFVAGDASSSPERSASTGATTAYSPVSRRQLRAPRSRRPEGGDRRGDAPDLVLFQQNYEGRKSRPSLGEARSHGGHQHVDLAVDGTR